MSKILITGAAGFIGGWVAESFALAGIPFRAGIRRWNSAVRLARRPTDMVLCDVMSREQLHAALDGCDAVVHCAVGSPEVIEAGTRHVLQVVRERGLRRMVHLSSVAVYGWATGMIDESHPLRSDGNRYGEAKIRAEEICREFAAESVPVVILRPSVVYGPFSEVWTVSFAKRLCSGRWGTFGEGGEGTCNLVYVTDVVQAIERALHADRVVGEAFNVNGGESLTWNRYFARFNEALGLPPLPRLKTGRIALRAKMLGPVRRAARFALDRFGKPILRLHSRSALAASVMKATESSLKLTPTSDQLKRYRQQAEYTIDKANERLGYSPRVGVTEGLEFSVAWLRHHGVLY